MTRIVRNFPPDIAGDMAVKYEATTSRWPIQMEVFGSANNYNGESWVYKEEKKS